MCSEGLLIVPIRPLPGSTAGPFEHPNYSPVELQTPQAIERAVPLRP